MDYKRLTLHLIQPDAVDSTNNFAANLLKASNLANGTVVMTKRQTSGRGQRGNSWVSEPGKNLTFSVILFPELKTEHAFKLTMAVSLAIRKTLADHLPDVSIKWPNDIYAGDRKIAGVLIENQVRGSNIVSSIIGVGVNINQVHFDPGLNAGSLALGTGRQFELPEIFESIYANLDFYADLLMSRNFVVLNARYHDHLFRIGQLSRFEDESGEFSGTIRGVSDEGRLVVQRGEELKRYDLKEIRFLPGHQV